MTYNPILTGMLTSIGPDAHPDLRHPHPARLRPDRVAWDPGQRSSALDWRGTAFPLSLGQKIGPGLPGTIGKSGPTRGVGAPTLPAGHPNTQPAGEGKGSGSVREPQHPGQDPARRIFHRLAGQGNIHHLAPHMSERPAPDISE